jgi:MYXO-CTERM domain-containing protein
MNLLVDSGAFGKSFQLNPNSVSGGGIGTYSGSVNGGTSTWNLNYNFSATSGADAATQSGTLSVSNVSGVERTYNIRLSLPTTSSGTLTGLFNGSLSATLITTGAGYFRSVESIPVWVGTTDALSVGALLTSPLNIVRSSPGATAIGTQSFGGSAPSAPAPSFGSNIAINLRFVLSANATVSFSSSLGGVSVPVPAPGALALLGVAGLGLKRRRRR